LVESQKDFEFESAIAGDNNACCCWSMLANSLLACNDCMHGRIAMFAKNTFFLEL
jgi:hypothetical protein